MIIEGLIDDYKMRMNKLVNRKKFELDNSVDKSMNGLGGSVNSKNNLVDRGISNNRSKSYNNINNKLNSRIDTKNPFTKFNNVNKSVLLSIISLFAIILIIQNILSLGITPGRTTINFESGLHQEVAFSIVNTEHKDMSIVFTVRGDLAQYITLNKAFEEFLAGEESKSFTYSINLPQGFEKPGKYEGEIVALELPSNFKEQGTFVGATVAVVSQLYVYVPYPNKYVEAEVNVIDSGGKINFIIPVVSRGKLDIVNVKAIIDIYTPLNEKVATIESNTIPLNSLQRADLLAEWTPSVNPGRYMAVATIIYDNEKTIVEKEFNIGELVLEILEINVRDFELGEIAKFNALIENKWSEGLKDVYLNILVYNNEGEIMADFKSPTYDLDALGKSEMVAYWDTGGVREGTYDGKIILKYGEKSIDRNVQMKIGQYDIEVVGLTGKVLVRSPGGGKLNVNNLLIIAVGVLIVANIIWFVLIKRILKKRK